MRQDIILFITIIYMKKKNKAPEGPKTVRENPKARGPALIGVLPRGG
jgi:hypothetical protein